MTLNDLSSTVMSWTKTHIYTKTHVTWCLHIVKGCTNWQTNLLQKYFYWWKNWAKKYSYNFLRKYHRNQWRLARNIFGPAF